MPRPPIPKPDRYPRLPWIALGIALALVLTRVSMQEYLRDAMEVQPGSKPAVRFPGPAAGVGLDLFCCLPALLVLARRGWSREAAPGGSRSVWLLAALVTLMLASVGWASDRFAALVLASHWCAAAALLWAASQLVRDWTTFRLVVAVLIGLLPVYLIVAVQARWQTADNVKYFEEHRAEVLTANGLDPGSFAAGQFERKLHLGESFGYFTSPNTFGGVSSLLLVVAVGATIQTVLDRERRPWSLVTLAVTLACGGALLVLTRSKGATATLTLSLCGFAALWRLRRWLSAHARGAFLGGCAAVIGLLLVVAAYGHARGRLPTSTLTFRWKYWVGSAAVFADHPLRGVGWGNFGLFYLAHRPPSAPEEIKDPHNLLVRFFVELGAVGGLLAVGWLAWLWRDLTRPASPATPTTPAPGVINFVAATTAGATVLYFLVGVDWAHDEWENFALVRLLILGVLILTGSLTALRSITAQTADDRPAPWTLYGLLLALGGMLLHNLIDFSLAEPGPLFLFALLTGAALGMRPGDRPAMRRPVAWLAAGVAACVAAAVAVWVPLVSAAADADDAEDAVRASRFPDAARAYDRANVAAWRLNADYPFRAGTWSPQAERVARWRDAVHQRPHDARLRLSLADALVSSTPPDFVEARIQFTTALALNPNDVPSRLHFADVLAKAGEAAAAREQYQSALRYNDQLDAAEEKRLTAGQLQEVKRKIAALGR